MNSSSPARVETSGKWSCAVRRLGPSLCGLFLLAGCGGTSATPAAETEGAPDPRNRGGNGAATPATGMQVLYEGEEPYTIALDDRYIYWASLEALRRAPLDGGPPVTLVTGQYLRGILLVGEYIYFSESSSASGRIARIRREGGEPEWVADVVSPQGMASADNTLYWTDTGFDTGSLFRAALDGSDAMTLAVRLHQPAHIALDDTFVYFASFGESCSFSPEEGALCVGGGINRLPRAGGSPEKLHPTSSAGGFVLNKRGFYWPASSPPRVMFAPHGGAEREVVDVLAEGTGTFTSDADALYWASGDKVLRMPFESEQVTRLASELDGASSVVVRGDWAYVAESGRGRILRVATDGSANRPPGPITGPCPSPLGSAEELALTPRADMNLELLALELEPENVTANPTTYERLAADIAAIRSLAPELADIGFFSPHDGKTVYMGLTDIGAQSFQAGEYSAWNCLNEAYGLTSMMPLTIFGETSVLLELHGIYNIPLVAKLYGQLPGVAYAEANVFVGDGPTLCAEQAGNRYEYVVDRAGGDCPAGCTEHQAHHFASDSAGLITALDVWSSESGEPAPAWFGSICR